MKIGVLTSGGDAPGMNAALRAVQRTCEHYKIPVYGIKDGFKGLVDNEIIKLNYDDVQGLFMTGGTILGTARLEDFKKKSVLKKASNNLKKQGITNLICIGGDGTFRGGRDLIEFGINVVCIPATIDNDICGTDVTIGFNTALNTIVEAIDKLRDTSSSHQRASVIEVMGRHKGDLAVYAGLCTGAEFVITPEHPYEKNLLIKKMTEYKKQGRRKVFIVVTENQFDSNKLAEEISKKSGFTTRATILGYIQRGGSPVPQDRILATMFGIKAVELLKSNIKNVGLGIIDNEIVYNNFDNMFKDKKEKFGLYELNKKMS